MGYKVEIDSLGKKDCYIPFNFQCLIYPKSVEIDSLGKKDCYCLEMFLGITQSLL